MEAPDNDDNNNPPEIEHPPTELNLMSNNLDHKDFKRIIYKLKFGRNQPRRKCRRLNDDNVYVSNNSNNSRNNHIEGNISSDYNFRTLNFSNNKIAKGVRHLSLLPESVQRLDLICCDLNSMAIQQICKAVERNKTLRHLHIPGNNIDDEGALYIGKLIETNKHLQSVVFQEGIDQRSRLTNAGVECIAQGIQTNSSLRGLIFGDDNPPSIRIDWLLTLQNALQHNASSNLIFLMVDGRQIHDTTPRCEEDRQLKHLMDLNTVKTRRFAIEGEENVGIFWYGATFANDNLNAEYYLLKSCVYHLLTR